MNHDNKETTTHYSQKVIVLKIRQMLMDMTILKSLITNSIYGEKNNQVTEINIKQKSTTNITD